MIEQRLNDASSDSLAFLAGGGSMGERIRTYDWSSSPLGPMGDWPQSLRSALSICLNSNFPIGIYWGKELVLLYNDEWAPIPGEKHPRVLGQSARDAWPEIWNIIEPLFNHVMQSGEAIRSRDQLLPMYRHGFTEECYFDYTFSPVRGESGNVEGIFNAVLETTTRVIGERRLRLLRELGASKSDEARTAEEACATAARIIAENRHDVPFVLLYLLDDDRQVNLVSKTGLAKGLQFSQSPIELDSLDSPWPFQQVATSRKPIEVDALPIDLTKSLEGVWPEPTQRAIVLPMTKAGQTHLAGFVVAGLSPRLALDDDYRGFLDLLAAHVANAVASAKAYEEERRRAESLAELDRAKTAFFSNVSHEFRTPLTLMLGPVEDILAKPVDEVLPENRELLNVVHRNGLRLHRLVNALLDFSRIEAGRVKAHYEATDLAALTADLASNFRSACEKAGLSLSVYCVSLDQPVFVDRGMWEKIVLNLLSNAFKFTFEGRIAVTLRQRENTVEVQVQDTGTGIPSEEISKVFDRFHRVENARGRTHEGSGIGLALVQELVKLHGGTIAVESELGKGTTFTIVIPLGAEHLPREQIGGGTESCLSLNGTNPFVEEALSWLTDSSPDSSDEIEAAHFERGSSGEQGGESDKPFVLVADDNRDMRRYIVRLLAGHYRVEAVSDGLAALDSIKRQLPELILSDVMMPGLDGFGLLRAVRSDPQTARVPVIFLSARTGEESRLEGVEAGADDYLVKPFSARELLARVTAQIQMARIRSEASESLRESHSRLDSTLAASEIGTWEFDVARNTVRADRNLAGMFGLDSRQAAEGKLEDYLRAIHPADRDRVDAIIGQALEIGQNYETDYRLVVPGVPVRWVIARGRVERDSDGRAVRLPGVVVDVTGQRRAEERLRKSEERRRLALDSAGLGAWNIDPRTGELTSDDRFRIIFHGSTAPLTYEQAFAAIHPDDRERIRESIAAATRPDDPAPYWEEYRVIHPDGSIRWVYAKGRANFERTETGRTLISLDGTVADITTRKEAEFERDRLLDELRQQDRRKDEFLATLAHELRNPLAPIRNGLHVLRLGGATGQMADDARNMMQRQLSQMVHLIDDLLDLSRISRGKIQLRKERVELEKIVQQAVETSRPSIEQAGHDLIIDIPQSPIYVEADVTRLAQVFSNLLNNAAKYTEPGGQIRLTVQQARGEIRLSVADNGIGIPVEMLPHVFEMFTQVDRNLERSQGGLGIGLSIVKRLCEMHGGSIGVRSEGSGRGSEFTVQLPIVSSLGQQQSIDHEVSQHSDRRRILVVDDNHDSAMSLAMTLKLMGNETKIAHDGLEALEVAAAYRPELILLDIGMPRLNGYETARRIRALPWSRGIRLVALTGWGQVEDRRKSDEAGFDAHLVKPVEHAALEKIIANLPSSIDRRLQNS